MTASTIAASPGADLRTYRVAQAASTFGSTLTATAVSVVAVVGLGAGPREVSLIVATATIPPLVLGPAAGVLLDRVRRPRRLMLGADLVAAAAVLYCAAAMATGLLTVAGLAALSFVLGLTRVVIEGLYFGHLTTLGVTDIGRARAGLQSATMLSRSVGASIAGPLVATVGAAAMFACDALTYLFSAYCLTRLTAPDRRTTERRQGFGREFLDGVRALRGHPLLAALAIYLLAGGAASGGVTALRAVFLLHEVALPVAVYGIPAVVATLCAAAGALVAPRVHARAVPARRVLSIAVLGAAIGTTALPLAAGPTPAVLLAACLGAAVPMFFGAVLNIALVTVVGDGVGDGYFARIGALLSTGTTAANMLGAVLGGVLGEYLGARTGIWVFVAADLLAALAFLLIVGRAPTTHDNNTDEPIVKVA
ncbi:MFS transporter [Nocardia pseudobrasiliensis]|uniref:Transmembrane secretion effector n=1 Tax=Nocardia pseudobrasiliensis TaxID=45979 RepID=A0A370IBA9_9NOCA|nr:MFS transporter [Nocardia pseudobrasiliensis]RDI68009.1 transmembrane secretion effector [Nocardia pseudobrasiliensis]